MVQQVNASVVQIIAQQSGGSGNQQGYGTGSGFVIDSQGHIVTNNHVVEGADELTVVLSDNRTAEATLVGADPQTDLAVLQIQGRDVRPLTLGDSSKLEVGETVVAIGSALGLPGGPTVTTGVVSALNRSESEPSSDPTQPGSPGTTGSGATLFGLIQTDAAVRCWT